MTGAELLFTPATHEYRTPDGVLVPNVTTILRAVGVSADFEQVEKGALEYRRQLGTAVHLDCHAFDDRDLDWATVDPRVKPYVEAWAAVRADKHLTPVTRERRVFHPTFGYCGTLDGIFIDGAGRRILIDIKTGSVEAAASDLQLSAYEAAYLAEHSGEVIHERWAIQLCPGLAVPYRITNYTSLAGSWKHLQVFLACLTVYAQQIARRRR